VTAAVATDRLVHVEEVWGTVVSLHLASRDPVVDLAAARDAVVAWCHEVDRVLSTFRPDSDLSRWRRGEAALGDLDPMVEEVLLLAESARAATGGAFDPAWSGGAPDPTGLVKGWAAERAIRRLADHAVVDAQVNAGGDVATTGERPGGGPWRIGVAHPLRPGELVAVVEGHDLRVATSGIEHRGAHLLRDGGPVADVASVTVVGPDLGGADAWSTALVTVEPSRRPALAAELDAAGWPSLVVELDGRWWSTPTWPAHVPSRPHPTYPTDPDPRVHDLGVG
jgi:thiamine biosynthesis lipoprotein